MTTPSSRAEPILVAGAGGFIGGWLARRLQEEGFTSIRAVDNKPMSDWYQVLPGVESLVTDLRSLDECRTALQSVRHVYNLACDMGGMGFIEANRAACMISVLINTHLLMAGQEADVERHFYASSACIYNIELQQATDVTALREGDAYPAMPEDGYGWEKLFSERMCRHFYEDFGIETRVARYHNVYGPHGTYDGGREKAPAAICRKVARAELEGLDEIEIWGDGEQTRSFMYIDDCLLRHASDHGQRHSRADQSRFVGARVDQPARRHRRGDRGRSAEAALQPRRAEGRSRPQLGQHAHPGAPRVGAEHDARGWARENLRLDLRRAEDSEQRRSASRRFGLMPARAKGAWPGP